ncbi:MAG: HisA/HisF-related TIM barrel protein [Clostridia bacterium]
MLIIPAVDILNNKVIRLEKGNFNKQTIYSKKPEEAIAYFINNGFQTIHVVNLEGAKGSENKELLLNLVKQFPGKLQVAGGISSYEYANKLLKNGAKSIVIGSAAIRKEEWIETIFCQYKQRVIIALDVSEEIVKSSGWLENTNTTIYKLLDYWYYKSFRNFLVTDINRDGLMVGPNIELYKNIINKYVGINLIASGGVSSLDDIEDLEDNNLKKVVVGKALYENKISLGELNVS